LIAGKLTLVIDPLLLTFLMVKEFPKGWLSGPNVSIGGGVKGDARCRELPDPVSVKSDNHVLVVDLNDRPRRELRVMHAVARGQALDIDTGCAGFIASRARADVV
jgi:hypothetical protein